jgi:hypothetical protein
MPQADGTVNTLAASSALPAGIAVRITIALMLMKCSLRQGLPQIQVIDQLSVLLRTPPTAPTYDDEWHSFATVLEAHADEEEREMIPVPASVKISDAELVELGDQMATRIEQLRESTVHKLRVKGRKSMLRAL